MGAFSAHVAGTNRVAAEGVGESERTYAMFTHLSLLIVHLIGIPILPALIMWAIKKDRSAFIDDHGREALNFQISLTLYSIAIIPIAIISCGVGALLWIPVYVLAIWGMIIGAIAANRGQYFRYPMCVRFVG